MRVYRSPKCLAAVVVLASLLVVSGCVYELPAPPAETSEVGGEVARATPPPPTGITIRLINKTAKPLDPEIYVGLADDGVDALFDIENKRTDFGVGGVGILLPDGEVTIAVRCGDHVLIATLGGIFGDDLTDPIGSGRQLVLEEDVNVMCGDTLTFRFAANGDSIATGFSATPGS